jgi:hypothetical protein
MKLIFEKHGSARNAWLSLFFVCACGAGVAQVSEDTVNTAIVSVPVAEVRYRIPSDPAELQKAAASAAPESAPGAGLQ